eukprot:COSAG01_NODE_8141_length_2906_cov_4.727823_2_plen_135_part_00
MYGEDKRGEFEFAVDDAVLQMIWVHALKLCGANVLQASVGKVVQLLKKDSDFGKRCAGMQRKYRRLETAAEQELAKREEEVADELHQLNAEARQDELETATAALDKANRRRQRKKAKELKKQVDQLSEAVPNPS